MRFQPVKCNMMQITRKRIEKIHASYILEETVLENFETSERYIDQLGILGKEMGYEISACQMQYDAKCRKYQVSWGLYRK